MKAKSNTINIAAYKRVATWCKAGLREMRPVLCWFRFCRNPMRCCVLRLSHAILF